MTALHLALYNHGHMDGKTKKPIDSSNVIKALLEAGAKCTATVSVVNNICMYSKLVQTY